MANNSNVSDTIYPYDSYPSSFLVGKNANIDANYGPWINTNAYETWLFNTAGGTPKEGTLIAVQPTEHADVTLYVYTSNVGEGTWKSVGSGSGGTGTDDIGYVPDNVEVQLLNKQVVSTSANQNLSLEQQANARANINAADADDLNAKQDKLSSSTELCTINGSKIYFGSSATIAGGSGSGSNIVIDNSMNRNSSNPVENKAIVIALAEKADKSNTVTTDATNQTISGEMVFEGGVTFDCETDFTSKSHFEDVVTFGDNVDIQGSLTLDGNLSAGILKRESTGAVTTTGLKTINSQSIIGDGNITISAGTNVVQADWNAASGEDGFIANKPITVSGTNGENASIAKNLTVGTEQSNKDLTVNGDATITGNVSLGTEASATAKTITLGSTTGAGNVADNININGIITSDVTIGKTDSAANNKNLTVNGDVASGRTFTQVLQVHNNTTLGTATTQSQTSNSSTVINGGLTLADITANGILKLDGNKKVISDTGTYMKFRSEVDTFDDLSNSSGTIAVGDVFYIKDTDSQVVATEITSDKNLRVIYSTDVNVTLNTDSEGTTPILSTSDFFSAFSTNGAFDAYPTFAYTYHKIYYNGSNVGDLKIVPVRTSEYGIIIALVSVTASKAWAASTTYDGGERNVWYIEGMLSNGSGVVELDVTHSTIPSGRNIKEFVIFGGGVTWKSIGRKTTNMINMIPITEDTEYAEIESILLSGNIPYLYSMDSNCKYGNQYHFCGGYTANSIDYYTFESVTYDNGSFKKVIKICEEATDPTWTTKTVTLTIDA